MTRVAEATARGAFHGGGRARRRPGRWLRAVRPGARARRIALSLAGWLALAALAAVALGFGGLLAAEHYLGYQYVIVTGGSMEPTIPLGGLAVMRPPKPEDLRVGAIVMYEDPVAPGQNVTHRVVGFKEPGGDLLTRGDANTTGDTRPVPRANVRAVYVLSVPQVGRVVSRMASLDAAGVAGVTFGAALLTLSAGGAPRVLRRRRSRQGPVLTPVAAPSRDAPEVAPVVATLVIAPMRSTAAAIWTAPAVTDSPAPMLTAEPRARPSPPWGKASEWAPIPALPPAVQVRERTPVARERAVEPLAWAPLPVEPLPVRPGAWDPLPVEPLAPAPPLAASAPSARPLVSPLNVASMQPPARPASAPDAGRPLPAVRPRDATALTTRAPRRRADTQAASLTLLVALAGVAAMVFAALAATQARDRVRHPRT